MFTDGFYWECAGLIKLFTMCESERVEMISGWRWEFGDVLSAFRPPSNCVERTNNGVLCHRRFDFIGGCWVCSPTRRCLLGAPDTQRRSPAFGGRLRAATAAAAAGGGGGGGPGHFGRRGKQRRAASTVTGSPPQQLPDESTAFSCLVHPAAQASLRCCGNRSRRLLLGFCRIILQVSNFFSLSLPGNWGFFVKWV